MNEFALFLTLGILLNILQLLHIGVFLQRSLCQIIDDDTFYYLYLFLSFIEFIIISFFLYFTHRKKQIETEEEEDTILSSLGIYLLIKFFLIFAESYLEKTIKEYSKRKIFFQIFKFIKTFGTMNSFITVLLDKLQVKERRKKIGLMIGIPLLLFGIFFGTNKLILYKRRKNNISYSRLQNLNQNLNLNLNQNQKIKVL